jgi:hypothetical protein
VAEEVYDLVEVVVLDDDEDRVSVDSEGEVLVGDDHHDHDKMIKR